MKINGIPISKYNIVYFVRFSERDDSTKLRLKAFVDRREKNMIVFSGPQESSKV